MTDIIAPRRGEFFTPDGIPTPRFITWIEALTGQGNASTTEIVNTNIRELFPWIPSPEDDFNEFKSLFPLAPPPENEFKSLFPQVMQNGKLFDVIAVTANHTTSGNEILICNNTALVTVTLNATPDDEEEVIIKRRDATVKVTGVKQIDGETTKTIAIKYDSPHLIFTAAANEYSII